jgi:hypothetical protein
MNQYFNLNNVDNAFTNNNELDRMAREINNNKKKLNMSVPKHAKLYEKKTCLGIDCLMDPSYSKFVPNNMSSIGTELITNKSKNKFFFNNDGTKISGLNYDMKSNNSSDSTNSSNIILNTDTINTLNTENTFNTKNTFNTENTTDVLDASTMSNMSNMSNMSIISKPTTFDLESESIHTHKKKHKKLKPILKKKYQTHDSLISDISSNYSSLSPNIKKQFKMKSKHLKNLKEHDIIEHTTNCSQCKDILVNLLNSFVNGQSNLHNNLHNNGQSNLHDNLHDNLHNNFNSVQMTNQMKNQQNQSNQFDQQNQQNQQNQSNQYNQFNNPNNNLNNNSMYQNNLMQPNVQINMGDFKNIIILIVIGIIIILFVDVFMK